MAERNLNATEKALIALYEKKGLGICDICIKCKASKSFSKAIGCWFVGDHFGNTEEKKILFVGKNARGNPGIEYPENQNNKGFLEEFNYSRDVLWCKSWAYWRYTKEICERLFPDEGMEAVAFTNIVKCNDSSNEDTTDRLTKDCCIKELGVIRDEIETIKPTHIIFYTNTTYDEWIPYIFDNCSEHCSFEKTIGKKQMPYAEYKCMLSGKQIKVLRVGHPERLKKEDYIKTVVNWV